MGTTEIFRLPWPEFTDKANGPNGYENLAKATDFALQSLVKRSLWTVSRAKSDAVAVATWGNVADITIPEAEALPGLYRAIATVAWAGWNCWHRIMFNNIYTGDIPSSTTNGSQAFSDQVTLIEATYYHPGGSLRVDADFGYGAANVTIKAGSRLVVTRLGDGKTAATSSDPAFAIS